MILTAPPPQIERHLVIVSGVGAALARAGKNATASPRPPSLFRVGNRFALPPLTRPTNKRSSEATPAAINQGEIFLTIPDKLFPTLTNSEQLTDFSMTPAEPLFMRSAKGEVGEKKMSG